MAIGSKGGQLDQDTSECKVTGHFASRAGRFLGFVFWGGPTFCYLQSTSYMGST